jgi:hypothetical protein
MLRMRSYLTRPQLNWGVIRRYTSVMTRAHKATIRWTTEQVAIGLPGVDHTTDPARFELSPDLDADGWSLRCDFSSPPRDQGNPSAASVQFVVDSAPHHRLRPGAVVYLFERGTGRYAKVEIVD